MNLDELPWQVPGGQQVQFTPYQIGTKTGGDAQVVGTGAISSENYVPGSAGWRIDGQGNVEFESGEFRGDLDAAGGTFSGDISGASGTFTGSLQIGTSPNAFFMNSGAFWIGDATFGGAPFRVTPTGSVYADAYYLLDGTIQQTNLTINGGNVTSGSVNPIVLGAGTLTSSGMTINAGVIDSPEIDGSATIIPGGQLASDNWLVGVSGWAIDGNGNAEFNNITARGALATGAPASKRIIVGNGGGAIVEFYSGDGDEIDNGYLNVDIDNAGASDFAFINLVSPSMSVGDRCYIDLRHYDNGVREISTFSTAFNLNSETVNINGTTNIDLDGGFLYFNGSSVFYDQVVFSNVVGIADGSASNPSLTFTDDANTGMFSPANDQIGLTTGGVLRFTVTNSAMFAPGMATTTAAGLVVERFGSAGNEIYAETSSGLLKANQRPADNMVPQLLMLEPRMWDALSKDSEGNVTVTDEVKADHNRGVTFDRPGFIVEEMANVWPEAVIFDDEIQPVGLDRMALITALVQAAKQFDQRLRLLELG